MIAEKLDFLMKLTNTKNSTLGRALSFDPSYISRIRKGKRGLPKNQPFIEPAAVFFARNIREDYQRAAISKAVCPGQLWPQDRKQAEELLISWLFRENAAANSPIGQILTSLSLTYTGNSRTDNAFTEGKTFKEGFNSCESLNPTTDNPSDTAAQSTDFYYGNEGKRRAVEVFLSELYETGEAQTLLLYSDEDMSWLYEEPAFAKRWAFLLGGVIRKGGRIKIIHTVSREITEMLEAVQKWLPLYAGGAIEPYFYPKLRDRLYHRTLFIARGRSALISDSVGSNTRGSLNILTRDTDAVKALEGEFMDFFALCKPLMKIFGAQKSEQFRKYMAAFEEREGDLIAAQPVFSRFTMPTALMKGLSERTGDKGIAAELKRSAAAFERNLAQGHRVTEIINLPSPEAVNSASIPIPLCDMYNAPSLCYTPQEFKAHIVNVMELLRTKEGYNIFLTEQGVKDVILYAKEDIGAIMSKSAPPSTVFGISEQSMTAAFWEYLSRLGDKGSTKGKTLKVLEGYIGRIGINEKEDCKS